MQKIVLFIEPTDKAFQTPSKIGNLFMNRFVIDEDASFEISQIVELAKFVDPLDFWYGRKFKQKRAGIIIMYFHKMVIYNINDETTEGSWILRLLILPWHAFQGVMI